MAVDRRPYVEWWDACYATGGEIFDGFAFFQRGRSNVWIADAGTEVTGLEPCDGVGLPFVRIGRRFWKPRSAPPRGATSSR